MAKRTVRELLVAGLRWWTAELADMLPRASARATGGRSQTLLLDIGDSTVTAYRSTNGRREALASVPRPASESGSPATPAFAHLAEAADPGRTAIALRVPPREVLRRVVNLPPAAAENLREVLVFEMHRRTPFYADAVYFDFRRLPGQPGDRLMQVELAVVRREPVDAVLAMLPFRGLEVAGAAAWAEPTDDGLTLRVTRPSRGRSERRGLTRLLWVTNLILLAAVVTIPLVEQGRAIERLRAQVAVAKAEAEAVAAVGERVETQRAERRRLIDAKREHPAFVTVLTELTAILPDTTWVHRLEIKSRRVRLSGTSETASALIGIIERSPLFRGAAFDAPVTRNPATGSEQFQLVFEINSSTEADDPHDGQNLQKDAGAIAAAGGLHSLR